MRSCSAPAFCLRVSNTCSRSLQALQLADIPRPGQLTKPLTILLTGFGTSRFEGGNRPRDYWEPWREKMARSKGPEEGSIVEDFPRIETFRDYCGKKRDFEVFLNTTDGGHFLRAREMRDSSGGYEFAAHHPASPFVALGRLRQRIAEGLSTRYLVEEEGVRRLGHDRAVGHIGYGCVVIDGEELPFDEFASMVQTYEGWAFEIRIVDPFDTL
jgi:hypothetical protein